MKKLLKFALCAAVVLSIAACSSGVSSKYPPSGDMAKDAKALIDEAMKDNRDDAKYDEMAASYEAYYRGEGKIDEFEKALEKAMNDEMQKQINDISKDFDKQLDDAVKDADKALDDAVENATKELEK